MYQKNQKITQVKILALEKNSGIPQAKELYNQWPYPKIPILASLRRQDLWQINLDYMCNRSNLPQPPSNPNIWIVGCGTFQVYPLALANPGSNILASDISKKSIKISKSRVLYHRLKNVDVQLIDLDDETQFPEEKFDYIECYGVLMCLKNPLETLKALKKRLKPNGLLRIMVYPQFGRSRIFQIQKLAKLLGLNQSKKADPKKLKAIMEKLPDDHPLKFGFNSYRDSKNNAGIVDAFFNYGDCGFTGFEIIDLIDKSGFEPRWFMHRPWGDPLAMADKLNLQDKGLDLVLSYLDLWQELRTNFVICLSQKSAEKESSSLTTIHPLFDLKNKRISLYEKAKFLPGCLFGKQLPSKTQNQGFELDGDSWRNIIVNRPEELDEKIKDEFFLKQREIINYKTIEKNSPKPEKNSQIFIGQDKTLNPLYSHIFECFKWSHELEFESFENQILNWGKYSRPLENDLIPWGLTPTKTYFYFKEEFDNFFKQKYETEKDFKKIKLKDESEKFKALKSFLRNDFNEDLRKEELIELWILIFSYKKIYLDTK